MRDLVLPLCLLLNLIPAVVPTPSWAASGNALGEAPYPPPPGYRVWYDGTWHLRGVAGDKARRFHGVLTVPGGASQIKMVPERAPGKVTSAGGSLRFEFSASGEAGIDFAAEAKCVVLQLMVDDRHPPQNVRIGQNGVTPALFPYEACR